MSKIEKVVLVRAPRARVWKAITDPNEFRDTKFHFSVEIERVDRVSLARRVKALEENSKGWEIQTEAIRKYVEEAA